MAVRKSHAEWHGTLKEGEGTMSIGAGEFNGKYSFTSRFGEGGGTNPEELLAAAEAGCFSMALAQMLEDDGYKPELISTDASVTLEKTDEGFEITLIELQTRGTVPDISESEFADYAEQAAGECPVSMALAGADITIEAELAQQAHKA